MAKMSKKRKIALEKIDLDHKYSLSEAMQKVKEVNTAKFNASVDLHIRLGVDPRKSDQAVRGTVNLPHGTGKTKRVLVFCTPDKEQEAKDAGAEFVGLNEMVEKVQSGWVDFDVVIAAPNCMAQVGRLGRVLGPRGLMPNPKSGTVSPNIGEAVAAVKGGKIAFRVDKFGIIHSAIGRVGFDAKQLTENAKSLLTTVNALKPASSKGAYIKSLSVASTMSLGVKIDEKSIN